MSEADGQPCDVEAVGIVPAPPEAVFEFLSELGNHWRIAGRMVDVVSLDEDGAGGTVRLRGPLGVRRTARTHVSAARAPRLLIGTAEVGSDTRARVSWTLAGRVGETRVRLAAHVERSSAVDRLLLRLGGRAWLQHRFRDTLEHLAARFEDPAAEGEARSAA